MFRHRTYRFHFALVVIVGLTVLVPLPGRAGTLDVSWTAPTTTVDGNALTDLASYRVYYDVSSAPCPGASFAELESPTTAPESNQTVSTRLDGLSSGILYYVSVTALDSGGNESDCFTPAESAVARADFAVSPTGTVNFRSVDVGSIADQVFTVQTTGGGTISGVALTSSGPFTVVSGSPFTLTGAAATQAVTVRFRPIVAATASASVNFTTASGDSITRSVTGTGSGADTTPPTIAITSPTSAATYTTKSASLTLAGTASDNLGVTLVTWANNRGGSGTATGTASWTASAVVLQRGTNVVTVTARDAAGNATTATLTISVTGGGKNIGG